jgi:site-specific DNA-cytosine methylase
MPRSGNPKQGGTGHLSRNDGKTYCLDTGNTNAVEIVAMRGRGEKGNIEQQLETNGTNKSNSLTTVKKDNLVRQLNPSIESGGKQPYQHNRVYDENGISPSLDTDSARKSVLTNNRIRRLTPIECERLQTVKDNYTNHVSDSQRYKMLGNGWTIEVIAHIFNYII